jgi:uncharacterized protein
VRRLTNVHEHFQSLQAAKSYLVAANSRGIYRTVALGSPRATMVKGVSGFGGEGEFNRVALEMSKRFPNVFDAFPTLNPFDPDRLERFKQQVARGATGLKLYSGHSMFHGLPLDHPAMDAIYSYCQCHSLPILFHVNTGRYLDEFERVLLRFPELRVICPHLCLAMTHPSRLEYLLHRYRNLYTDVSMGQIEFLNAALVRFSDNSNFFRRILTQHRDRILFGTDIVITDAAHKTVDWLGRMMDVYTDLLEKSEYTFFGVPDRRLTGLGLDSATLERIYFRNFENLVRSGVP